MLFRIARILREQENEQGAAGAENTGASGTEKPASKPADRSIHDQARDLPWVQKALAAEKRLSKLEAEQAEAKQKAEQDQLKAKGDYEAALKMEQQKREKLEANHKSEIKQLQLKAEFATAGIQDLRAVQIFANDFNPDTESAAEFVSRIKADEANALYFSESKQPTLKPPAASGNANLSITEEQAQKWKTSDDPKKRARAQKFFSAKYFSKEGKKE